MENFIEASRPGNIVAWSADQIWSPSFSKTFPKAGKLESLTAS